MGISIIFILFTVIMVIILGGKILHIINNRSNTKDDLVITVAGHKEDMEFILRDAINRSTWKDENNEIICLDHGMDEETKKICKLICKDYHFVHLKKEE